MPQEAVWAALGGEVIQGKLEIVSLRSLMGEPNSELIIYSEDEFAKDWILSMLRTDPEIATDAIEVYSMGGDGTAVDVNRYHNQDPGRRIKSICIIDGDSRHKENADEGVFRLPGEAPEKVIFDDIIDVIDDCSGVLAVRCMRQFTEAEKLKEVILEVNRTNYDHHLLFSQIGEKLGFINENVIRAAFMATWCERYPDAVKDFLENCKDMMPLLKR